jgi:hypothetical protein
MAAVAMSPDLALFLTALLLLALAGARPGAAATTGGEFSFISLLLYILSDHEFVSLYYYMVAVAMSS